ncbi:hypothetical protein [Chitinophaga pinensis]|uniref:Uncharacterized protein n=1 Tax=Chitinophaga pinensis TaxID=79329 RepID=A0A5C6LM71_9BACT|nr:hypothetical protein [Chitinophaga pinensis]TWV93295.1 hypothetical protein FEF09_27460 [Chitinophaga pinensis]
MPIPTMQRENKKIRFRESDFDYAKNVWLTTLFLGGLIASVLISMQIGGNIRSPRLSDILFLTLAAAIVGMLCSVPVFILYLITIMIINIRDWGVYRKKSLLMLVPIIGLAGIIVFLNDGKSIDKYSLFIFIPYAIVIISSSFYYKLKP